MTANRFSNTTSNAIDMATRETNAGGIGHNGSPPDDKTRPFDQDAAAVRAQRTEAALNRLQVAIRDPALDRGHLKVLANITENINSKTGTAWPSRRHIAEKEGLSYKTVLNNLYDLRGRRYLDWDRRPHPDTGKSLTHYVLPVTRYDREFLVNEIEKALPGIRERMEQQGAPQGGHSGVPLREGRANGKCPPEGAVPGESALQSGLKSALQGGEHVDRKEKGKEREETPRRSAEDVMAAALNPESSDLWWTSDCRIEVVNGFKFELETSFPGVNLTEGLAIVAGEHIGDDGKPRAHGLKLMGAIRRKFAYLANDNRLKGASRPVKSPTIDDAERDRHDAELAAAFRRADEEDAKCPP